MESPAGKSGLMTGKVVVITGGASGIGRGAIVNNGSVTGLVGAAGVVGNVATKHGVSGLTKSAALDSQPRESV